MFAATYITGLFAIIIFIFAGLLIYERGFQIKVRYVALIIFSAGMWALSNAFSDISYTREQVMIWNGIALLSVVLLASALLAFTDFITSSCKKHTILQTIFYFLPFFVTIPFAFTHYAITEVFLLYTAPSQSSIGVLYIPLTFFVYAAFGLSTWYLFRYTKLSSTITWQQVVYITLGISWTLVAIAIFTLILPVVFNDLRFYTVAPLSTIPMMFFISYAIFKHRLIDVRLIIQKGIIYTLLLSGILGIYLIFVFLLSVKVQSVTHTEIIISGGIASVIGILGAPYIKSYFKKLTNPFFFKDTYDYSEALHELSESLNKSTDLSEITKKASKELKDILKAEYVYISLRNKNFTRFENPPALVVPIVFKEKTIGTIMLGHKRSGDNYSYDDQLLLRTFSYHVAATLERARLYNEVKKYSKTLEEKVIKRTTEIKRLQEEQRKVMVDIAHELQTPLTLVKARLGALEKNQKYSPELAHVEKSIDSVSEFIYRLLNLAHLELSTQTLQKNIVNVSNLLEEVVEYVETIASEQGIKVISVIEPNICIKGDSKRLEELVLNLTSNAIKYIGDSLKEIKITLSLIGDTCELSVSDTGKGINQKDLSYIFERFYRVQDQESEIIKGSGLGLSISREIVEKHGGSIRAQSKVGVGTCIIVTLPLFSVEVENEGV